METPVLDSHPTKSVKPRWAELDKKVPLWACLWYALTLGGWLASWGLDRFGPSSAAGLTSLAILTELVSLALRSKLLTRRQSESIGSDVARTEDPSASEITWLFAWAAQANALGLVAMLSPSLAAMWPALIVTAVGEALVLSKMPSAWKTVAQPFVGGQLHDRTPAAPVPDAEGAQREPPEDEPSEVDAHDIEPPEEYWTRSTQEGRTETGERYLSGWVRFELAEDQKSIFIAVGFSPAFAMPPEIELDQEVDGDEVHCDVELEHVTPAGMRVAIKRSGPRAPLAGRLLWHAVESDQPAALLRSRLP